MSQDLKTTPPPAEAVEVDVEKKLAPAENKEVVPPPFRASLENPFFLQQRPVYILSQASLEYLLEGLLQLSHIMADVSANTLTDTNGREANVVLRNFLILNLHEFIVDYMDSDEVVGSLRPRHADDEEAAEYLVALRPLLKQFLLEWNLSVNSVVKGADELMQRGAWKDLQDVADAISTRTSKMEDCANRVAFHVPLVQWLQSFVVGLPPLGMWLCVAVLAYSLVSTALTIALVWVTHSNPQVWGPIIVTVVAALGFIGLVAAVIVLFWLWVPVVRRVDCRAARNIVSEHYLDEAAKAQAAQGAGGKKPANTVDFNFYETGTKVRRKLQVRSSVVDRHLIMIGLRDDKDYTVCMWNTGARMATGIVASEAFGKPLGAILVPDSLETGTEMLNCLGKRGLKTTNTTKTEQRLVLNSLTRGKAAVRAMATVVNVNGQPLRMFIATFLPEEEQTMMLYLSQTAACSLLRKLDARGIADSVTHDMVLASTCMALRERVSRTVANWRLTSVEEIMRPLEDPDMTTKVVLHCRQGLPPQFQCDAAHIQEVLLRLARATTVRKGAPTKSVPTVNLFLYRVQCDDPPCELLRIQIATPSDTGNLNLIENKKNMRFVKSVGVLFDVSWCVAEILVPMFSSPVMRAMDTSPSTLSIAQSLQLDPNASALAGLAKAVLTLPSSGDPESSTPEEMSPICGSLDSPSLLDSPQPEGVTPPPLTFVVLETDAQVRASINHLATQSLHRFLVVSSMRSLTTVLGKLSGSIAAILLSTTVQAVFESASATCAREGVYRVALDAELYRGDTGTGRGDLLPSQEEGPLAAYTHATYLLLKPLHRHSWDAFLTYYVNSVMTPRLAARAAAAAEMRVSPMLGLTDEAGANGFALEAFAPGAFTPSPFFVNQVTAQDQAASGEKRLWEIGSGSSSVVDLMQDTLTGALSARKTIIITSDRTLKNLMTEVDIMYRIQGHPNTVGFRNCVRTNREFYMFFEYCRYGSLRDRQRDSPLGCFSAIQVASYAEQVLRAVDYMHSCGVAHRDIKPANILLCDKSHVKVADFGSATTDPRRAGLAAGGTLQFLAPERLIEAPGMPWNKHSMESLFAEDVWSCGLTFLELVGGKSSVLSPHTSMTSYMNVYIVLRDRKIELPFSVPVDPATPYLQPVIVSFLRRMLRINPAERATAADLLNDAMFNLSSVPKTDVMPILSTTNSPQTSALFRGGLFASGSSSFFTASDDGSEDYWIDEPNFSGVLTGTFS